MNWGTLASTSLGAILAIGATLLTDRSRWRRERSTRDRDNKQQLYAEYLGALWLTRHRLRDLRRSLGLTSEERIAKAGEIIGSAFHLRYQMLIIAPEQLGKLADAAFLRARDLRDCLDEPDINADGKWSAAQLMLGESLDALTAAMRADLALSR